MPNNKVPLITWEVHQRNHSLAQYFPLQIFEFVDDSKGLIRYPKLLLKTFLFLLRSKSDKIIVQNPSLVLALFTTLFSKVSGRKVIIDAHNIGIHFSHSKYFVSIIGKSLTDFINRTADYVIVTNNELAEYIKSIGGKPIVLPDPIPYFTEPGNPNFKSPLNVIYICSYAMDEPYLEVIRASEYLSADVFIHITGNYKKANIPTDIPSNIILTGFLKHQDYVSYLANADVVIDLTTFNSCLVCGAYEAISLSKPLILSNTTALKDYFSEAAIYCDNTAPDIANKINYALSNKSDLVLKSEFNKIIIIKRWNILKDEFRQLLNIL